MFYSAVIFGGKERKKLEKKKCTQIFQELVVFSKYVIRKFFEVAENNKKVFMELFFWKNQKDAMEITEGYGTTKAR